MGCTIFAHADHLSMQSAADVNSWIFVGIFIGGPIFGFLFKKGSWVRPSLLVANIGVLVVLRFLFFYHAESSTMLGLLAFY